MWARSPLRSCAAACCLSWLAGALRRAPTGDDEVRRVALVLRGEAFRAGPSGNHKVANEKYKNVQMFNYQLQMDNLIVPFEKAGYEVDVFSVTYSTPYNEDIQKFFGPRLKVFSLIPFSNADQATNAVKNLNALEDYTKQTGKPYRWVVFTRHDARFNVDMMQEILSHSAPDDTFLLNAKHPFYGPTRPVNFTGFWSYGAEQRCQNLEIRAWFVRDRQSISWYSSDHIQIIPRKFLGAFRHLLDGPTWTGNNPMHPRWPLECWAEIGPLLGGEKHIEFIQEGAMNLCKADQHHGMSRHGEVMSLLSEEARRSGSTGRSAEEVSVEDLSAFSEWDLLRLAGEEDRYEGHNDLNCELNRR